MSKKISFTTVSPLPPHVTRGDVLAFLGNHENMIVLNPLVKSWRPLREAPAHAAPDEAHCRWYSVTDTVSYVPGVVSGAVTYTAAFFDLSNGIQTHSYAPAGVDIRCRWTLNGSLPGEPRQPVELGIGAPLTGLYLREDVELRVNVLMASFVKKALKRSHETLIGRLNAQAAGHAGRANSTSSSSISTGTSMSKPLRRIELVDPHLPSPPAYSAYDPAGERRKPAALLAPPQPSTEAAWSHRRSAPPAMDAFVPPPQGPHDSLAPPARNPARLSAAVPPRLPEYVQQAVVAPQQPSAAPIAAYRPPQRPNSELYPEPLRLRQASAASSLLSANSKPARPRSADLQPRPVLHLRVPPLWSPVTSYQHPDYPQLNPYVDDDGGEWEDVLVVEQPEPEPEVVVAELGTGRDEETRRWVEDHKCCVATATLSGPFVAELM